MTTSKHVVLITGASSGIGRAIAECLASKGALVYAGARKEKDIDELNTIENIQGTKLDVTKPDDIEQAVQKIETEMGYLDCLINNAGLMGWGAVIDRDMEYFHSIFDVNLWGPILMVKAMYPLLKKSPNFPVICNISSQGANYTMPFWSPYMMSKHALEAFSGCLRRELMLGGVRVVSIAPGAFKSEMLTKEQTALDEYEQKYHSEFTPKVVKMLGFPIRKKNRRGLSPVLIGELIDKILRSKSCKARYQTGRRFVPDIVLEKFPTWIVDRIFLKILR
jgi:NAD(P)-dependent dehydrogenase (short-subunit alcohol dehydrogenase family)